MHLKQIFWIILNHQCLTFSCRGSGTEHGGICTPGAAHHADVVWLHRLKRAEVVRHRMTCLMTMTDGKFTPSFDV